MKTIIKKTVRIALVLSVIVGLDLFSDYFPQDIVRSNLPIAEQPKRNGSASSCAYAVCTMLLKMTVERSLVLAKNEEKPADEKANKNLKRQESFFDREKIRNIKILDLLLPYNDRLKKRDVKTIDEIVLHSTELPTIELARKEAEKIKEKNEQVGFCAHYYIDRDGTIYRYIEDDRIAYHAIKHNENGIGIELINKGRYPDWLKSNGQIYTQKYTDEQINAVIGLMAFLKISYPGINKLSRHSDLDHRWLHAENDPKIHITLRNDPGPLFPWRYVLKKWKQFNEDLKNEGKGG